MAKKNAKEGGTMKVIIKDPGFPPYLAHIPNEPEALRQFVGGRFQTVTIACDLVVICNEDGRMKGLPLNCAVCGMDFSGTILICSHDRGGGLTDIKNPTRVMQTIRERDRLRSALLGLA